MRAAGILLFYLILVSCTARKIECAGASQVETIIFDNRAQLDSLYLWVVMNIHTSKPTTIDPLQLPKAHKDVVEKTGIQKIKIETDYCSYNDTRGGTRLTMRLQETKAFGDGKCFLYLVYARCLTKSLANSMERNATFKEVTPNWYLVEKSDEWNFE